MLTAIKKREGEKVNKTFKKCAVTYNLNFSFHCGASDLGTTRVARMNFAGTGPRDEPSPLFVAFPVCAAVVVIAADAERAVLKVLLLLLTLLLFKLLL